LLAARVSGSRPADGDPIRAAFVVLGEEGAGMAR
jgi:hypothetical protein